MSHHLDVELLAASKGEMIHTIENDMIRRENVGHKPAKAFWKLHARVGVLLRNADNYNYGLHGTTTSSFFSNCNYSVLLEKGGLAPL